MLSKYSKFRWLLVPLSVSLILSLGVAMGAFRIWQDKLTDLLFTPQPAPTNILIVKIDEESIQAIGQWPWPRSVFGELINHLQSAKVIGIDVNFKEPSRLGPADDLKLADALVKSKTPIVFTAETTPDNKSSILKLFADKVLAGYPNIIGDPDGIIRTIRFAKLSQESFSLRINNTFHHLDIIPDFVTRIRFWGPQDTFQSVSVKDILNNKIAPEVIKDRIILIGATAPDLQDYHQTPVGLLSGVEIQANALATLLAGLFFSKSNLLTIVSIIILALISAWLSATIKRFGFLIFSIIFLSAFYSVGAFLSFDYGSILDLLYPNLAIIFTAGLGITIQYLTASKEKKFIQESFSRYLAPQVIHELLHDPSKLRLGGSKENLTILFSDIRNFTTMSEGMTPEHLTNFLNRYLSRMTNVVLENRGVIDKYIGDAIMAFWGAPLPNPHHARDGVWTALNMVKQLVAFNEENKSLAKPIIDIGIGLNSGDVTVGNMGSEKRFDYTVMGDNVNLASRLEALTKAYGVNILISQATADLLSAEDKAELKIVLRELDRVQVKGKKQGVTIFQVVAEHKQSAVNQVDQLFNMARQAYYAGSWDQAIELFDQIITQVPSDGPAKTLRERCLELKQNPPTNWQGTYELTHE